MQNSQTAVKDGREECVKRAGFSSGGALDAGQRSNSIARTVKIEYCINIQLYCDLVMQLWLCLRLAELAIQCLPQRRPQAAAVIDKQRIYAVNAAASLLGLEPGMDPASARVLAEEAPLQLLARDPAAESSALSSLSCWAYGVTPHLYSYNGDCLMLEIGGSLRLFGGLAAVLRHCQRGLACRGFSAEYAVAPTALAAWVLSFNSDSGSQPPEQSLEAPLDQPLHERLGRLPLRLFEPLHAQFAALERSGLKTFGEVLGLPAAAVGRRCGSEFVQATAAAHRRGDCAAGTF
jgi:protein ImuB